MVGVLIGRGLLVLVGVLRFTWRLTGLEISKRWTGLFCCFPTNGNTVTLTTKTMINIGQRIKEELDRQERSVSWLARNLNRNRTAVYRILHGNSIDTTTLASISRILGHDFFKELSDDINGCGL